MTKSTATIQVLVAPQGTNTEDPRLARGVDHKLRQILIELSKEYTEGKSIADIKEKIEKAIRSFDPPPPEGAKVQEISKLQNGGVIIQLKSKEAAAWLQESMVKMDVINKLGANTTIKDR